MLIVRNSPADRKPQIEFFRQRAKISRAVPKWAKAEGLGAEAKLLQQIIAGGSYHLPWSWKILKGQRHSAEKLGFTERTFKRHLSVLRDKGILIGHHTPHRKDEVPTFSVAEWVLEGLCVSAKLALNDVPSWHLQGQPEPAENSTAADVSADTGQSVEYNHRESPPNGVLSRTSLPEGSRRLRRRCLRHHGRTVKRVANLGADPDQPSIPTRQGRTPASRLAEHFESEWNRVRSSVPADVAMSLPSKPWPMGGKQWFYKWAKSSLLPEAGSEAEAEKIITRYCDGVIARRYPRPSVDQPVFNRLAREFAKLTKVVAPATFTPSSRPPSRKPKWGVKK